MGAARAWDVGDLPRRRGAAYEAVVKVLIACEFSGVVRDAFLARGHNAISCDLLQTEVPGPHILGRVEEILDNGCLLYTSPSPRD